MSRSQPVPLGTAASASSCWPSQVDRGAGSRAAREQVQVVVGEPGQQCAARAVEHLFTAVARAEAGA